MRESIADVWEGVAFHPDPNVDLGYEMTTLSIIHVEEGGEKYLFLPGEEEHLLDNEYIVASPDSVCDPADCR